MTRNYRFKNTAAKDGRYSVHIRGSLNSRLTEYCRARNLNKAKYVEQAVAERLEKDECEWLNTLDKESLVRYILQNKREAVSTNA